MIERYFFVKCRWPLKGPFWDLKRVFNLRNRTEFCLASWGHRLHPWRWQSSSWHARCMWRHHGWHSRGIPWGHHGSLRRWGQRYVSRHLGGPDDGLQAWWYPGCYHEVLFDDAWRLLFPNLYHPFHAQTYWCSWLKYASDAGYHVRRSIYTSPPTTSCGRSRGRSTWFAWLMKLQQYSCSVWAPT